MMSTNTMSSAEPWTVRDHPPSYNAAAVSHVPRGDRMHFMHQMLDNFGPKHTLLGRYQLLGKNERRTGGVNFL